MIIKPPLYLLLISLTLGGCLSLPKEQQEENILPLPNLESSAQKSLDCDFFSLGDWPEREWWHFFGSSELDTLVVNALAANPTIQAIEQRIEQAAESAKVVRSRLFPLVFFDADETWEYLSRNGLYRALNSTIPLNANLVDLTLSFNYEFDFWGQNRNLFQAALGRQKAEEAEAEQVKLIIATSLAQTFFALKTNLVRQDLYNQLYEVRQNTLRLQKLLEKNSLFSRFPILLAEEELEEVKKLCLEINDEIITNRHLINVLQGAGPDTPLALEDALPDLPAHIPLPETLSLDLLARRPDLMAQIWRVEALAHEVGAAKADFYPNINLKGLIGLESIAYNLLFQSHSKTLGLLPAIHLPIFTAGAIRANLRAKKATFDQAVYDYNELILRSTREVADLLTLSETIFQKREQQKKIVSQASARLTLTDLLLRNGLYNALALYKAQEELIQKQLDDVTLLYSQYVSLIKLIKAMGGGYMTPYGLPLRAEEIACDN